MRQHKLAHALAHIAPYAMLAVMAITIALALLALLQNNTSPHILQGPAPTDQRRHKK